MLFRRPGTSQHTPPGRDITVREPSTAGQSLHDLPVRPGNVHWGYFDASLAPVLRVRSGDLIRAEAITHHAGDAPELMMDADIRALYAAIPEYDREPGVHIMAGPIHVADDMPGDMLEVRYLEMVPRLAYGSNLAAHWGYLIARWRNASVSRSSASIARPIRLPRCSPTMWPRSTPCRDA
jgi:acetamidase/formamidase